jgi:hypothetical protein
MSHLKHPSSYRDPSGYVFKKDGLIFRQVNKIFQKEWESFNKSGCYSHLTGKDLLIGHDEIKQNLTGDAEWFTTLKPAQLPFISFPWEWSFDMLKDAALLTLDVLEAALEKNFILKDATAYNIQWLNGRPLFIDSLSFEPYGESKPWIAYRQFCEQFLGPLLLMHYSKQPMNNMYTGYPDGLPIQLVSRLLPWRSRLSIHTYLHIHLNAKMSGRQDTTATGPGSFSKKKLSDLIRSLRLLIHKTNLPEGRSTWSAYYEEASLRKNYLEDKKKLVNEWVSQVASEIQFSADLGANDGEFSRLISKKGIYCLAADLDANCINRLYRGIKREKITNIQPIILDLSHPSPGVGLNNEEHASFFDRCKGNMVVALALVHHLAIGKNIPLESIAELFKRSTDKYLLIEFVPKEDEKVQLMLNNKKDIYRAYNEENFVKEMGPYFKIEKKQIIADSQRSLYLFSRV